MKTKELVKAYKILQPSKVTKMDDADKMKVVKAARALRPIAEEYEKNIEEGIKTLRDERFEEMQQKGAKHNEAIKNQSKDGLLSLEELDELNKYFADHEKLYRTLVQELDEKDVAIEIPRISEDAFIKFAASNDNLTCEDLVLVGNIISE